MSKRIGVSAKRGLILIALHTLFPLIATAKPVIFLGEDLNINLKANPDNPVRLLSRPNADKARTDFFAGLAAGVWTENFDSLTPTGQIPPAGLLLSFGSLGATLKGVGEIRQHLTPDTFKGLYPISGNQFIYNHGPQNVAFTVEFTTQQAAFGFYATDVGDNHGRLSLTLNYITGTSTTLPITHTTNELHSGSVLYIGIVDTTPFSSVVFQNSNGNDGFGFDDMTIASPEQVPCGGLEISRCCQGSGACCVELKCVQVSASSCKQLNGIFFGDNSSCLIGACCIGGRCAVIPRTECGKLGGNYLGDNSSCDRCR